jgi:carbon monoxide dehydrogenase subunit G
MARYVTVIDTPRSPEDCFAALSDFSSAAEWDPGVSRATRREGGPVRVGSRFDLVAGFLGREVPLTYEVTELDEPRLVVLRAENATIVSLDTITVEPREDGGSRVTYDADLRLKGLLRLGDLGLRLAFGRIGDQAAAGLREHLGGVPAAV